MKPMGIEDQVRAMTSDTPLPITIEQMEQVAEMTFDR